MTNDKKQQIIELLKDKEVADSIGVISEGLVKLFESIPADEPEEKKPYDPGFWLPEADERYYKAGFNELDAYAICERYTDLEYVNRENCWKTSERAIQVGKKMKFLMLVERIRDVVERENRGVDGFWVITFDFDEDGFDYASVCKNDGEPYTSSLFYNREDAREACNILNKMRADGQLGWLSK